MKNENFINIAGWMINELKLKGNELIIYAIIYGFSQDGKSYFEGSRQYLADGTNSTLRGVDKCLKSLIEKGLIRKQDRYEKNVKYCMYQCNIEVVNKVHWGSEQSTGGVVNKVHWGSEQSSHNNIEYNTNINNKENIIKENFIEFYNLYPKKEGKLKAETSYIKAIKKVTHQELMDGVNRYIKHLQINKIDRQYIKQPATWLNQGCWCDEYENKNTNINKSTLNEYL